MTELRSRLHSYRKQRTKHFNLRDAMYVHSFPSSPDCSSNILVVAYDPLAEIDLITNISQSNTPRRSSTTPERQSVSSAVPTTSPPHASSSMTERKSIAQVFADAKASRTPAFITFTTCGYKTTADTVDILLALQRGGANIIELGVPYSDPQADGPTIQKAHQAAVDQGVTLRDVLATVQEARGKGLVVPVVLMGYYNNFLQYGEDKICADAKAQGVDGFIVVDLPPEEAKPFSEAARSHGLANIALVSPTTTEARMKLIDSVAHGFVYCVSLTGVTGARSELPPHLEEFMATIRKNISHPLALGFGLSTREHFVQASQFADGIVMGSKIIKVIDESPDNTAARAANVEAFVKSIVNP